MQNVSCLSVVRKLWLKRKKEKDIVYWFRLELIYRFLSLLLSVSDMAAFWRSLQLIYSSFRKKTTWITYSLLKCLTDTQFEVLTNSLCQKIYWAQTDIFRMSGPWVSLLNWIEWMFEAECFSCLLISSYNRNVGKEVCPLSHRELILLNIRREVPRQVPHGLTWIPKMDFFEAKKNV